MPGTVAQRALVAVCLVTLGACVPRVYLARLFQPRLYVGAVRLHDSLRVITLAPGEKMRLAILDDDVTLSPVRPGVFDLQVPAGPEIGTLRWETDGGTIVTTRIGGTRIARYRASTTPGLYHLRLMDVASTVPRPELELGLLVLTPLTRKQGTSLHGYEIGQYPHELGLTPNGRAPDGPSAYRPVRGFVAVTAENQHLAVSAHFHLRDFLCKQQPEHFPKYVVLDVRLLDKLERLIERLHEEGHEVTRLAVMSGYRTPAYNRAIGNETIWSRHTLGDAADVFVDENRDGVMDDLDGDGRITRADAEVLLASIDRLDRDGCHTGGAAAYAATGAHGPFVHVDTRGYRARW